MMKRRRVIVGNWKMYGRLTSGLVLARNIAEKAEAAKPLGYDIVLCPPATLIWPISEAIMGSPVMLGAQDCHPATHGAYTGNLSAAMFTDLGCRYVLLGHSERRTQCGESDELVSRKVMAAQLAGLTTIVCVGESADELSSGSTEQVIERQIKESIPTEHKTGSLIVAYEPVWAIGSGQQPSLPDISIIHRVIRKCLGAAGEAVPVLYGGSVTPANASAILAEQEVDGVLVGSASLTAEAFWSIAQECR